MPILCSSAPLLTPAKLRSTRKAVNFSSYFCENCEQISSSTICDPHLLPVENVVRTVGAKIGTRTRREGVGTRERLGKRVGSQQFGSGQFWQVLLFLLSVAEVQDRQSANTGVR
jgi:hypothetical protein